MLRQVAASLARDTSLAIHPVALSALLIRGIAIEGRVLLRDGVGAHLVTVPAPANTAPVKRSEIDLTTPFTRWVTSSRCKRSGRHRGVIDSTGPFRLIILQVRNLRVNFGCNITLLPIASIVPGLRVLLLSGQVPLVSRDEAQELAEAVDVTISIQHPLAQTRTMWQLLFQRSDFPLYRVRRLREPSRHIHLRSSSMQFEHSLRDLVERGVGGESDALPLPLR